MPLNDGAIFAGFRIVRLLGSGGMGEVYLAQHPRLPRSNALTISRHLNAAPPVLADTPSRTRRPVSNDSARGLPAGLLPPWAFSQWCEDHRPYQPMRFDFTLKQKRELPCSAVLKEMVCR
jgi:serine/threonine protein kinase